MAWRDQDGSKPRRSERREGSAGSLLIRLFLSFIATFLGASLYAQESRPDSGKARSSVAEYARQLGDSNKVIRREAAYQLSRMGANARAAVPELIQALSDAEQQVWFGAVVALANIGPEAADAVPALMRGLTQKGQREARQVWYRSSYALSRIGTKAIPALVEGLKSEDALVRSGSAQALGWIGKEAVNSLSDLVPLLADGNGDVRRLSAEALAAFGTNATPQLVPLITHSKELVRASSARGLERIGLSAAGTAPTVFEQLKSEVDPEARAAQYACLTAFKFRQPEFLSLALEQIGNEDARLRHAATEAVIAFGDGPAVTVPAMAGILEGTDASRKVQVGLVLARLGSAAAPASALLVREAQQERGTNFVFGRALTAIGGAAIGAVSNSVREFQSERLESIRSNHWAVRCLVGMGPPELPAFDQLLKSEPAGTRLLGLEVVRALGKEASESRPFIETSLSHENPRLRARALVALLAVVRRPESLVTQIARAFQDSDPSVRAEAAAGVARLGPSAKSMIPALVLALKDPDPGVQLNAANALGALGADAKSAAPGLTQRLQESSGALRLALVEALGQMGDSAAEALPELMRGLDEDSLELRVAVLQTLGAIGSKAASAIPAITSLSTNLSSQVRAAAVTAVAKLDERPAAVLPILSRAMEDSERPVRHAAAESLGRLGEAARDQAPGLFRLLEQPEERTVALDSLRRIRSQSVPDFVKALASDEPAVRVFACESLGSLGQSASNAIPALKTALKDRYDFVRRQARQALRSIEGKEDEK